MASRVRIVLRGRRSPRRRVVCGVWFKPTVGLFMSARSYRDALRRADLIPGDVLDVEPSSFTRAFTGVHVYDGFACCDFLPVR